MYFHEFDSAGRAQEDPSSGWEEARKVTSILVDAATPKDGYTAEHAVEVARLSRLVGMNLGSKGARILDDCMEQIGSNSGFLGFNHIQLFSTTKSRRHEEVFGTTDERR